MKFRRDEGVEAPTKAHATDAGYDLYAPHGIALMPGACTARIDLGVGFAVPEGFCGFVVERSSQGKKGVSAVGPVVDHGYTGNVHVTLVNNGPEPYTAEKGDRICQMLVLATSTEGLEEVGELEGARGDNGHGSSGA